MVKENIAIIIVSSTSQMLVELNKKVCIFLHFSFLLKQQSHQTNNIHPVEKPIRCRGKEAERERGVSTFINTSILAMNIISCSEFNLRITNAFKMTVHHIANVYIFGSNLTNFDIWKQWTNSKYTFLSLESDDFSSCNSKLIRLLWFPRTRHSPFSQCHGPACRQAWQSLHSQLYPCLFTIS